MSRPIANKATVFNAAEAFLNEGVQARHITNLMIRNKLGGGSFQTISPLLREWQEMKLAVAVANVEVPGEFQVLVENFTNQMWNTTFTLASEKLKIELDRCERILREKEALELEIDQQIQKLNDLEQEILENQQRFVHSANALSNEFNSKIGELKGGLRANICETDLPKVDSALTYLQNQFNDILDKAKLDQTELLNGYLNSLTNIKTSAEPEIDSAECKVNQNKMASGLSVFLDLDS